MTEAQHAEVVRQLADEFSELGADDLAVALNRLRGKSAETALAVREELLARREAALEARVAAAEAAREQSRYQHPPEVKPPAAPDEPSWARRKLVIEPNPPEPPKEPEPEPAKEPEPKPGTALAVVPPLPVPTTSGDWLAKMNEQHVAICRFGNSGKFVVAELEPVLLYPSQKRVVFQAKTDFESRYSNEHVKVVTENKITYKQLGVWWLTHTDRRECRSVTFQPGGPELVGGDLNLWVGWAVKPMPGDWSLIREHYVEVIAGGDPVRADYLIHWIAWTLQNPDKQAEVALVLIGEKGAGKGISMKPLERLFGCHSFKVSSGNELFGRFNDHLKDCALLIADEAFWAGDNRHIGRLQSMITEDTLSIEPKGIGIFQVKNFLHVVMLAEPGWVVPAGRNERRYAIYDVGDGRVSDRRYFNNLQAQIDGDGPAAMFYELRGMDLKGWHPRQIPEELLHSRVMQEQQTRSLPAFEQWYLGLLQSGVLPGPPLAQSRPNTAHTGNLLADAKASSPKLRYETEVSLWMFLKDKKRLGVDIEGHRASGANGAAFPLLSECREAWVRRYGPQDWNLSEEWSRRPNVLDRSW
jgi:hypothetical protein